MHLEHDGVLVEMKIQGAAQAPQALLKRLDDVVAERFGHHVELRVITELAITIKSGEQVKSPPPD